MLNIEEIAEWVVGMVLTSTDHKKAKEHIVQDLQSLQLESAQSERSEIMRDVRRHQKGWCGCTRCDVCDLLESKGIDSGRPKK